MKEMKSKRKVKEIMKTLITKIYMKNHYRDPKAEILKTE